MNILEETIKNYIEKNKERLAHHNRFYPTYSSTYINYKKYKKLQGKCLRSAYYECLGIPEDKIVEKEPLSIQRLLGEYVEKMLVDIFDRQEILLARSLKFEILKYKIFGKLDAVIIENNKPVGVEIKSIGSNQYQTNSIFGLNGFNSAPKWQNLFQTLIYCYAFKGIIDKFYLIYIRRDNGERKTFEISIEPIGKEIYPVIDGKIDYRFTIDSILERYTYLSTYIESMVVPVREYCDIYPKDMIHKMYNIGAISKYQYDKYLKEPYGDIECSFCKFKKNCNNDK